MNPDEWLKGMQNEAEYSADPVWADEARLSATRDSFLQGFGLSFALFGLLALVHVAFLLLAGPENEYVVLWLGVMDVVALLSVFLSKQDCSVWSIGLGALLYLPLTWVFVILAQDLWGDLAPKTPQISDESSLVLPVLAMSAAGAVKFWRGRKAKVA